MTRFLRDMSHFDTSLSLTGYDGTTHKITEGTTFVDPQYQSRMNAFHSQGVAILGSYHVLHTGNLTAQLNYWIAQQDKLTPWWRDFPYWIMQVDAEKWPTDQVSATTVKQFAELLVARELPAFCITYASQGQFGDGLSGIATPLWNARYPGGTSYPGDSGVGWGAYSGKTPTFWQYTSTAWDKNAYRGTLPQLKNLINPATGGDTDVEQTDNVVYWNNAGRTGTKVGWVLGDQENMRDWWVTAGGSTQYVTPPAGSPAAIVASMGDFMTDTTAKLAALETATPNVTLSDADRDSIVAAVTAAVTANVVDAVKTALREGTGTTS